MKHRYTKVDYVGRIIDNGALRNNITYINPEHVNVISVTRREDGAMAIKIYDTQNSCMATRSTASTDDVEIALHVANKEPFWI